MSQISSAENSVSQNEADTSECGDVGDHSSCHTNQEGSEMGNLILALPVISWIISWLLLPPTPVSYSVKQGWIIGS